MPHPGYRRTPGSSRLLPDLLYVTTYLPLAWVMLGVLSVYEGVMYPAGGRRLSVKAGTV